MSKATTNDYRALDVRKLRQHGVLIPGWAGKWRWWRGDEIRASIDIQTESREHVRLRYQVTTMGKTETKDYPVVVTWTPCHLGGERPWFACPCCGRRVAILYGGVLFACRHCQRLNYRSQQVSKRDAPCERSWRLRLALGCDEGLLSLPAEFIQKPKGMHWRTFERKQEQLKKVDARAVSELAATLESLKGHPDITAVWLG